MTFDWHTWLDVQRLMAERRTGSTVREVLEEDPEYAHALDVAGRADRLERKLADAEREARGMSPGRGRS